MEGRGTFGLKSTKEKVNFFQCRLKGNSKLNSSYFLPCPFAPEYSGQALMEKDLASGRQGGQ